MVNAAPDPMMHWEEAVYTGAEMHLPTKEKNAKEIYQPFWLTCPQLVVEPRWEGWWVPFFSTPLVSLLANAKLAPLLVLSPIGLGMPWKTLVPGRETYRLRWNGERRSIPAIKSLGGNSFRSHAKVLVHSTLLFSAPASSLLHCHCKEVSFQLCKFSRSLAKSC